MPKKSKKELLEAGIRHQARKPDLARVAATATASKPKAHPISFSLYDDDLDWLHRVSALLQEAMPLSRGKSGANSQMRSVVIREAIATLKRHLTADDPQELLKQLTELRQNHQP